jgi:hypothetical protein
MRLPSSISIAITPPPSETSDSGSDTHLETRSLRHHIRLRTSSPASRKSLLSVSSTRGDGDVDHTETTTRRQSRRRGFSGSSLLNPQNCVKSEQIPHGQPPAQPSVQGPEAGDLEGANGPESVVPSGSADNPSPIPSSGGTSHYTITSVDHSFVSPHTHISRIFSHGTSLRINPR